MKFDHTVKHDGVYYRAGEEVPVGQEEKSPAPSSFTEPKEKRRGRPTKNKEQ